MVYQTLQNASSQTYEDITLLWYVLTILQNMNFVQKRIELFTL